MRARLIPTVAMVRALLATLLLAVAARADGFDKVRLKSGAVLQGTIVEDKPGRPLRIKLLTGSVRTVPRGQVSKIEPGHAAAPPKREVTAIVSLRDGGSLRGVITDWQPGREITLRLSSGRRLTLSDEDVARVEVLPDDAAARGGAGREGGAGGPGSSSGAGPTEGSAGALGGDSGAVQVHSGSIGVQSGSVQALPGAALVVPALGHTAPGATPPPPLVLAPATPQRQAGAAARDGSPGAVSSGASRAGTPPAGATRPDRRAPALDTVYLTDGSVLRGTLRDPKTLVLANGRTRALPPSDIRAVEPHGSLAGSLDTVVLATGAVLRGTITEDKPGDALTLRLVSGRSRTVPYPQIERVTRKP